MNENINIPVPDIGSAVDAASKFETLGITGVLFLVVIILVGMLIYKARKDEKMNELVVSIDRFVTVSKQTVDLLQQVNTSKNELIMQKLEVMSQKIEDISDNLRDLEKNFWSLNGLSKSFGQQNFNN